MIQEANDSNGFQTFGVLNEKDYFEETSDKNGFADKTFTGASSNISNSPRGFRNNFLDENLFQNERNDGNDALTASQTLPHSRNESLLNYCITCRTRAKMGENITISSGNDTSLQSGFCDNKDCSVFLGNAPSPRAYQTYSNDAQYHTDDEHTSDDVPLLITAGSNKELEGNITRSLSEEELIAVDHCHPTSSNQDLTKRAATKKAKRQLMAACVLCSFFIAGEIVGGKISNSLAIMSDAAHMTSDFATFCVSLFSIWMGEKQARKSFNFGLHRAEAVGALFTIMIIWFVTGILFYLACSRLHSGSFTVEPDSMMVVAGCAVVFNIVLGGLLHGAPHGHTHGGGGGGHGHSHAIGDMNHNHSHIGEPSSNKRRFLQKAKERHLNIRAALIHVLGDLIQSVGVLISSVIIKIFPSAKNADPICTILFSIIVMCTTTHVLRDVVRILMEGRPKGYDYDQICNSLLAIKNVVKVHDLRLWSLTNDQVVLTVHLAVNPEETSENERILQVLIFKSLRQSLLQTFLC